MEEKKERNLMLIIIAIILVGVIALMALPIFGPGPFRSGPVCDITFIHPAITDLNETDTLRLVATGTTPNVEMEFFVNGLMVADMTVSPNDTISIQGDFGDVGDEVEVEVLTKFGTSPFKESIMIKPQ